MEFNSPENISVGSFSLADDIAYSLRFIICLDLKHSCTKTIHNEIIVTYFVLK